MEKQIECDFTFVWIIKNFSMWHSTEKQYIVSPVFVINTLPGKKWHLKLFPKQSPKQGSETSSKFVGLFLYRNDDLPEDCKLRFNFQFLDRNEKDVSTTALDFTTLHTFQTGKLIDGYGFPRLFTRSSLLKSLICDILIIKCSLKPVSETNEKEIHPSLFYETGLFTDVILRACGAQFDVHKAMLWARWPELAEKLDEQKSSEQDFDVEPKVLEVMIKYVYTGKLNLSSYMLNFEEVYMAARKYGLRILSPIPGSIKTCATRINTEKISFVWPIDNFSSVPVNTELHHEFKTHIPEFIKWDLRVHVSEKTETDQMFDVFICKIPGHLELKPIFVRTKVSFDDVNSEDKHVFENDEKWKCAKFSRKISRDPDDILFLRCEFNISNGSLSSEIVESSCIFATSIEHSNLNRSLRNLYKSGTLSDVTVVAESRKFSVHRFILCSQSSVFCRMFETEMSEPRNYQVEIPDVDPDIIHEMLLFLYTGNVGKLSEEMASQLYLVADKYDISTLKNVCSSFFKSCITVANVCKILQLADMHCNDNFYQIALEFFSDHLQEIYSTDEWKERSSNNFCVKLLQDVITLIKPTK